MKPAIPLLAVLCLILFAACNVNAGIGIARDFLVNNTIVMQPGTEYLYQLYITNTEDHPLEIRLLLVAAPPLDVSLVGSDSIMTLPAKTYNKPFKVSIKVPNNAPTPEKFKVNAVLTSGGGGSGQIMLTSEVSEHFMVQVGDTYVPDSDAIPPPSIENGTVVLAKGTNVNNSTNNTQSNVSVSIPQLTQQARENSAMGIDYFNRSNRNSLDAVVSFGVLIILFKFVVKGLRSPRLWKSLGGAVIVGIVIFLVTEALVVTPPFVPLYILEAVALVEFVIFVMAYLDAGYVVAPHATPQHQAPVAGQPHSVHTIKTGPRTPTPPPKHPFKPRRRDEILQPKGPQ